MLDGSEKWIGPFQVRKMLEHCLDDSVVPKALESGSAYLVTRKDWRTAPTHESIPLYVGGNTGEAPRFRTRVGDLLADAFGFFTSKNGTQFGRHATPPLVSRKQRESARPLHSVDRWQWMPSMLGKRLYTGLKPALNRVSPSRCKTHLPAPPAS
jgi:hypothetical protein